MSDVGHVTPKRNALFIRFAALHPVQGPRVVAVVEHMLIAASCFYGASYIVWVSDTNAYERERDDNNINFNPVCSVAIERACALVSGSLSMFWMCIIPSSSPEYMQHHRRHSAKPSNRMQLVLETNVLRSCDLH